MSEFATVAFGVMIVAVAIWVRTLARRIALLESAVSGLASLGGEDNG